MPIAHASGIFGPLELLPMLIAAGLYAKRSMTLAERGRPVPLWRQICFALGLLTIAAALITPISEAAEDLVIVHMIEHLMIGDLASLLLVLGLTGPLLQPILAIRFFDRLRVLAHPAVALPLYALNMYFWHAPPLYDAAYGGRRPTSSSTRPSSSSASWSGCRSSGRCRCRSGSPPAGRSST